MKTVRVTELVTQTPDNTGKVQVRLANGTVIAIPADMKDLVMRHAAEQGQVGPADVVVGTCGTSYVEVQNKQNENPVRMTTGFNILPSLPPAVFYYWLVEIGGPDYRHTYESGDGLALRRSWDGSYDSPEDQLEGDYSAAVQAGSFALLSGGQICFSGLPDDDEFLTALDFPIKQGLSLSGTGSVAPPVAKTSSAPALDPAGSPAFMGSDARRAPSDVVPLEQTRVADTTVWPYRAVTALHITDTNGHTYKCTGFLYAPNMVATAGHCLHIYGVWAQSIEVVPAQNVNEAPFGRCRGTMAYSVRGWVHNNNRRYDYGAVKLDCNVGNATGWFGMRWTTGRLTGTPVTVTGFPADLAPTGSMWTNSGSINNEEERQVTYPIVLGDEESGAPVYTTPQYQAQAVHAYGPEIGLPDWKGTRITRPAFGNYMNWRS